MKYRLPFFLCWFLLLPLWGQGDFYLWQRRWDAGVRRAAEEALAAGRRLAVLAAEFEADGRLSRIGVPPELWRRDGVRAVFRVHLEEFRRGRPERLAAEAEHRQLSRLELDIDVPERQLAAYRDYLAELKRLLPERVTELSITALPVHLRHAEFAALLPLVDFYVLQLHGLHAPRHRDDRHRLLDADVVAAALNAADRLPKPAVLALPTYAYALGFDPESGEFRRLSPTPYLPPELTARLAAPDPALLRRLIGAGRPVIYFRLPAPGDSLNYDLPALEKLERGEALSPHLEFEFRRIAPNAVELWVTPREQLALAVAFELRWREPRCPYELPRYVVNASSNRAFGIAPTRLELPFPGCGVPVRAALFFYGENRFNPTLHEVIP